MPLYLCQLVDLIEEMPAYQELLSKLKKQGKEEIKAVLIDQAKPYLLAALYHNLQVPLLIITAQPENAKKLYEQTGIWCGSDNLSILPEPDTLPYQHTIADYSIEQERLRALYLLSNKNPGRIPIVISSVPALVHRTIGRDDFMSACQTLRTGMQAEPLELIRSFASLGYKIDISVEVPGSISHRGDIVDIFPPTSDLPVRLEFFGNTIESIRLFDPVTQRSQESIQQIMICPAAEVILKTNNRHINEILNYLDCFGCLPEVREQIQQEISMLREGQRPPNLAFYAPLLNSGSLLDYLPENGLIILDEPSQIEDEINYLDERAKELRDQKSESGELPTNFPVPYFQWNDISRKLNNKSSLVLTSWVTSHTNVSIRLSFSTVPSYAGQLGSLISKSTDFLKHENRLIFISNQASRLSELFESENVYSQPVDYLDQVPPPGSLTLIQGSLDEGWKMDHTYLLTDREIFGFVKERRLLKKRPARRQKLTVDFDSGDYVVHIEHGIGQFAGTTRIDAGGSLKEYLVLTYAAGDKLYVPTDQIDRVTRYVGAGEHTPILSRLGTQEWNRTKQKIKESVEEIAQDLLDLYAVREISPGYPFSSDTVWQKELEASFPYIETPDQIKVQEEVKNDMSSPKPMDRLVVGDVGYGKTEIAIRAAFKAVMDNKQVAVLVPTTVLAEQHYLTFQQRMGTFPIKIDVLSRFRTPREQKLVVEGLARGSIDICIGTHRLLQKDVIFKDLGLLVIDEEQRFGVSHKEHFKKLREQVDVLTLSATPIPRTLHMSLVGVRDMSVIETPPENRLPIHSYIAQYNEQLIREAILRELERNGQVFFVHNRVQGITGIANKLKALVPEARIEVAHGQMPEEKLERVMVDFQKGDINLLVCTTIIESGLDLPNVNTLIINRADKFGLTQLYQLRGRIGRGSNLAYAYFLYDKNQRLTPTATKRLQTIFGATELGAGFDIATRDLEIRGAGTLLGTKQSGNISAVGFNLYTRLLAQAVEDRKTKISGIPLRPSTIVLPAPSIDLPLQAYIPDTYISDVDTRLGIYQRITEQSSLEQVSELALELKDRFGNIPPEVQNLLYILKIKIMGQKAGIESISTDNGIVNIQFPPGSQFNRHKVANLHRYGVKIGVIQIIINLKQVGINWQDILAEIIVCS